jgi:hypothetical protein
MKKLLFIFAVLFTLTASAQTAESGTYYCVQVCATHNPELLRPEMISILQDTAFVEQCGDWYRIMFIYPDKETAEIMHTSWLKQWHGAIIVTRTEKEIQKMTKLYSEL